MNGENLPAGTIDVFKLVRIFSDGSFHSSLIEPPLVRTYGVDITTVGVLGTPLFAHESFDSASHYMSGLPGQALFRAVATPWGKLTPPQYLPTFPEVSMTRTKDFWDAYLHGRPFADSYCGQSVRLFVPPNTVLCASITLLERVSN